MKSISHSSVSDSMSFDQLSAILVREIRHYRWLSRNLKGSRQEIDSKRRIRMICIIIAEQLDLL